MDHHQIVVVGGGNAGISLTARLLRDGAPDVAVVSGGERLHRYRPLLNYVGAGEATLEELQRPMGEVVPGGCTWLDDAAVAVDPTQRTVTTRGGRTVRYDLLVLCPGLEEDWEAVPGLAASYASGWASSTFVTDAAPRVRTALSAVESGTVVFTVPPEPAPCGATALKPLFMACDDWRRRGVLERLTVRLVLPEQTMTPLREADRLLDEQLASYDVRVHRRAQVTRLDPDRRSVTVSGSGGDQELTDVSHAHVVPPYRAPAWIGHSGLAGGRAGLVDTDPETLRHRRHPEVWGLGDAADLATRPSGGALRKQVDVLADNLHAAVTGGSMRRYDGYTVMPITTDHRRLLLVEVDREGRRVPTVPVPDLVRPRRTTWWVDRHVLPQVYWRRILRGRV
jgi:sulfide:quinone oxidoreductase